MRNQIRHFRHQRGLTLQALGDAIGLTPQSISRIETGKMRLSTDWMARIALALHVRPTDLLESDQGDGAYLLGEVAASGAVSAHPPTPFRLAMPANGAKAVRLLENCGPYLSGAYLVCAPLPPDDFAQAVGHDCLVEATIPHAGNSAPALLLCRVISVVRKNASAYAGALMPLNSGGILIENVILSSVAPVRLVMQIIG